MTILEAFAMPFLAFAMIAITATTVDNMFGEDKTKPTKMWIWYRADQEPSEEHDGARGYWTDYTP